MSKLPLPSKSFPPPCAWETGRGKEDWSAEVVQSTHHPEHGFVTLEDPLGHLLLPSCRQTTLLLLHCRLKHPKMEQLAGKLSVFLVGFFPLVLEQVLPSGPGWKCAKFTWQHAFKEIFVWRRATFVGTYLRVSLSMCICFPSLGAGTTISVKW